MSEHWANDGDYNFTHVSTAEHRHAYYHAEQQTGPLYVIDLCWDWSNTSGIFADDRLVSSYSSIYASTQSIGHSDDTYDLFYTSTHTIHYTSC